MNVSAASHTECVWACDVHVCIAMQGVFHGESQPDKLPSNARELCINYYNYFKLEDILFILQFFQHAV